MYVIVEPNGLAQRLIKKKKYYWLRKFFEKSKTQYLVHNTYYAPTANRLGLPSIRLCSGLINGKIEFSTLVSLIDFEVHQRSTRTPPSFYVPHATTNYLTNDSLRRLMSNVNVDPNSKSYMLIISDFQSMDCLNAVALVDSSMLHIKRTCKSN